MSTLVYIASGNYKIEYENLPFDSIYLVDIRAKCCDSKKVKILNMDALESINYFKSHNIEINYLVILRESQGEGGQTYNLCSDMVMGYFMTILPKSFVWICNSIDYYNGLKQKQSIVKEQNNHPVYCSYKRFKLSKCCSLNYVSLNLPYRMEEIDETDYRYINPNIFTRLSPKSRIHTFQMTYAPRQEIYKINNLTIRLIQDSIWMQYDELDHIYISFKPSHTTYQNFFTKISDKVSYYKQMGFEKTLHDAYTLGHYHIGFTPHYWHQYDKNYQKGLENFYKELNKIPNDKKRSLIIDFYYMNSWVHTKFIYKAIRTISINNKVPIIL